MVELIVYAQVKDTWLQAVQRLVYSGAAANRSGAAATRVRECHLEMASKSEPW